jgi:aryl-alcohol dehydrogenase-like predicted oxidoreductase
LIGRHAAGGVLQWCQRNDTRVIVYSPMQVGLLTDSFTASRMESFAPEDWRRSHPEFQSPQLERNLALRDSLRTLAEARSTTVGAVAVAWTLSWPQVTGAIVGASTAEQVEGWIEGASIVLNQGELETIAMAIARSGAGSGPTRP